jgi:uncharacterized membrane protein YgcG
LPSFPPQKIILDISLLTFTLSLYFSMTGIPQRRTYGCHNACSTVAEVPALTFKIFNEEFQMNIYIGNLSPETNEDNIRQAFEAFGQVLTVNIIRDKITSQSRGFAFVGMPSETEGKAAISQLNGTELNGQTISVEEGRSKPRPPGLRSPRSDSRGRGRPREGGRPGGFGGGRSGHRGGSPRGGSHRGGPRGDRDYGRPRY